MYVQRSLKRIATAVQVAAFLCGLSFLGGCGAGSLGQSTVTVTEANNNTTVTVPLGGLLVVQLPSNPSTGYQWEVTAIDNTTLTQDGQVQYVPSQPITVGSGGTSVFTFAALSTGNTAIQLQYIPPGGGVASQTFSLTVGIR